MIIILAILFFLIILLLFFNVNKYNSKIDGYKIGGCKLNGCKISSYKIGGCKKLNEIDGLITDIKDAVKNNKIHDKRIGTGITSLVYKHKFKGKLYAIKINNNSGKTVNFNQEIKILKKINDHPPDRENNIIWDYGSIELFPGALDRKIIIVLEYSKIDLFTYMDKYNDKITKNIILDIIMQIFNALIYLHGKNIIHRDVKIENIVLFDINIGDKFNKKPKIKLIDFESACCLDDDPPTKVTIMDSAGYISPAGTPGYMDPYASIRNLELSPSVDIWATGVILYKLLNEGKNPFGEDNNKWVYYQQLFNDILHPPPDITEEQLDNFAEELVFYSEPSCNPFFKYRTAPEKKVFFDKDHKEFKTYIDQDLVENDTIFVSLLTDFLPILKGCLTISRKRRFTAEQAFEYLRGIEYNIEDDIEAVEEIEDTEAVSTETANPGVVSTETANPGVVSTETANPGVVSTKTANPGVVSTKTANYFDEDDFDSMYPSNKKNIKL